MTTTKPTRAAPVAAPDVETHVADLPPLQVTRTGIPADEHLPEHVPQSVLDEQQFRRRSRITWIVVGTLCLVFALAAALMYAPPQAGVHMGLGGYAWTQYRAGERVPGSPTTSTPPGLQSPFTGVPLTGIPPF